MLVSRLEIDRDPGRVDPEKGFVEPPEVLGLDLGVVLFSSLARGGFDWDIDIKHCKSLLGRDCCGLHCSGEVQCLGVELVNGCVGGERKGSKGRGVNGIDREGDFATGRKG